MKKFYTLILGALVATSASAEGLIESNAMSVNKADKAVNMVKRNAIDKIGSKKAPAKIAATASEVAGNYEVDYYVELQDVGGPFSSEMTVTEGASASALVFNTCWLN